MAGKMSDDLPVGSTVVETDGPGDCIGKIISIDDENCTAWVRWSNGHDSFDVSWNELCPVEGN